jgi:hypothetical protein
MDWGCAGSGSGEDDVPVKAGQTGWSEWGGCGRIKPNQTCWGGAWEGRKVREKRRKLHQINNFRYFCAS